MFSDFPDDAGIDPEENPRKTRSAIVSSSRLLLDRKRSLLSADSRRLDAVSPLRVLERGYAVVIDVRDGRAVTDASVVEVGDELDIRLGRGRLRARTIERVPS